MHCHSTQLAITPSCWCSNNYTTNNTWFLLRMWNITKARLFEDRSTAHRIHVSAIRPRSSDAGTVHESICRQSSTSHLNPSISSMSILYPPASARAFLLDSIRNGLHTEHYYQFMQQLLGATMIGLALYLIQGVFPFLGVCIRDVS